MITDNDLMVSNDQAVTVTDVSDDTVDLTNIRDIAIGQRVRAFVICTANGTPGAGTLNIQVISGSDVDGSGEIDTTIEVLGQSQLLNDEDYTAGMEPIYIEINMDPGNQFSMQQRYLGLRYVAGVAMPAGYTFTGGFIIGADTFRVSYPGGFVVV